MQMTPAEVLSAAADHVEKVGWNQGSMYDTGYDENLEPAKPVDESPCCAVGALNIASGWYKADRSAWESYHDAREILADHLGVDSGPGIPSWNDADGRTQAEVVTALREAAKKAAA